jgi:hypothetical protein
MQITHEEAIQLIQYRADQALKNDQQKILGEHLKDCAQCRAYAHQQTDMEIVLKNIMRKQWSQRPAPLSIANLLIAKNVWKNKSTILITRTALISVVFTAFVFIGMQFTFSGKSTEQIVPGMGPIPTPSTQSTATSRSKLNCQEVQYRVQENDTLDSIANHYATSKETIMFLNKLSTETLHPSMEIMVPSCDSTPTSTTNPPTFTITPG